MFIAGPTKAPLLRPGVARGVKKSSIKAGFKKRVKLLFFVNLIIYKHPVTLGYYLFRH